MLALRRPLLRRLTTLTLFFSTFPALGRSGPTIAEQLRELVPHVPSAAPIHGQIRMEPTLDFFLDTEWLGAGNLQMAVQLCTRRAGCLPEHIDIDAYIPRVKNHGGYYTLARTAIIYPNKTPDYFAVERYFAPDFQRAFFHDTHILHNDPQAGTISTRTDIYAYGMLLQRLRTTLHLQGFASWDDFASSHQLLDRELWEAMLFASGLELEAIAGISTTYSHRHDLKPHTNSYGGRATNFYYAVGSDHTLHISYRIVTFKGIPNFARASSRSEQFPVAWQSMHAVQELDRCLKPNQTLPRQG